MTKIKEYEVGLEQMKVEQKRVEGEQKRKYLEEEAKVAKHKAEYQVCVTLFFNSSFCYNNDQKMIGLLRHALLAILSFIGMIFIYAGPTVTATLRRPARSATKNAGGEFKKARGVCGQAGSHEKSHPRARDGGQGQG